MVYCLSKEYYMQTSQTNLGAKEKAPYQKRQVVLTAKGNRSTFPFELSEYLTYPASTIWDTGAQDAAYTSTRSSPSVCPSISKNKKPQDD